MLDSFWSLSTLLGILFFISVIIILGLKKRNRLLVSTIDQVFDKLFNDVWQQLEAWEDPEKPDYAKSKISLGFYYTRAQIFQVALQQNYSLERTIAAFIADEAADLYKRSLCDSGDDYDWLLLRDKASALFSQGTEHA